MRDIRNDLKERLKSIKAERFRLETRFQELEGVEESVLEMLRLEEGNFRSSQADLFGQDQNGEKKELREFVEQVLKEQGTSSVIEIQKIATGRNFKILGKAPGQRIQGTLLALLKKEKVQSLGEGRWKYTGLK